MGTCPDIHKIQITLKVKCLVTARIYQAAVLSPQTLTRDVRLTIFHQDGLGGVEDWRCGEPWCPPVSLTVSLCCCRTQLTADWPGLTGNTNNAGAAWLLHACSRSLLVKPPSQPSPALHSIASPGPGGG